MQWGPAGTGDDLADDVAASKAANNAKTVTAENDGSGSRKLLRVM